ncbi:9954_t:CDS:2, partial [Scutellospora calospora]
MRCDNKTTKCCCCIPLRAGVIIITLLSLIGIVYSFVSDILSIISGDNSAATIVDLILNIIFLPIFIFGVAVTCCAKSARLLRIYAIIYNIFTVIEIVYYIVSIIPIIVYRNDTVNECINLLAANGSSIKDPAGYCQNGYNQYEAISIVIYILVILILVHFALVVSAYSASRKAKENDRSRQDASENNASLTHEIPAQ